MAGKKANRTTLKVASGKRSASIRSTARAGARPTLAEYMDIIRHMATTGIKLGGPKPPPRLDELWIKALDKQIRALNEMRTRLADAIAGTARPGRARKRSTPAKKTKVFKSKVKVGGPVRSGSAD